MATLHRLLGSALLGGHVVQKARGTLGNGEALQDNLYNKGTAFVTQVVGVAVIRVWIRPLLPMLLARLAWAEGEERVKEEKGQWN